MEDIAEATTKSDATSVNQSLASADTYLTTDQLNFLKDIHELIIQDAIIKGTDRRSKVVEFHHPKDSSKYFDVRLGDKGCSHQDLLKSCQDTVRYSIKTGHPLFLTQAYARLDVYGLAGSWITDALNTSLFTYEVAPVFTMMEQEIMHQLKKLVGFTTGDGLFSPGGSISNMYGLSLARYYRFPEIKTKGMQALPKVCIFSSQTSHLRLVPVDDMGRMIPLKLEQMVKEAKAEGYIPFHVNATCGTTVAGAFDPVEVIADICQAHGMWLHADCCLGGTLLFSKTHKDKLKGIHRADSISWNAHKLMGVPLQCCAFITKHEGLMHQCHSAKAQYLFQQDKFYDVSYDTGDMSIQCGRKVDVFKLWLMWKAKGYSGLGQYVDNLFDLAGYITKELKKREGFRMVYPEPECTNICFWYIPPSMIGQDETSQWWTKMAKVAPLIKERMVEAGSVMITYTADRDIVNFFRVVLSNCQLERRDCDFFVQEIERLGKDINAEDLK